LYKKNNPLLENLDWHKFVSIKHPLFELLTPKLSAYVNISNSIYQNKLKIKFNRLRRIEKSRSLIGIKHEILYMLYVNLLRLLWLIKFALKHPHTLKIIKNRKYEEG